MNNRYGINAAKNAVKSGIMGYLVKDKNGNYRMKEENRLPFYLEGSPGIGKTQMITQIANELGIGFVSFSITHHSRNTVLGLPIVKDVNDVKYTEYTMSEIIAKVLEKYEAGEKEGVLLLDEFNCMSDTLMPVMLSFLQTKNIGAHSLPEGWIIILCGNPTEYNKNARKFDYAVMDRLRKLSVDFDTNDFFTYAKEHEFEYAIQEYCKLNPNNIYLCANDGKEEAIVTSRAWENLDIAMKMYRETDNLDQIDENMILQFIKSKKVAKDFYRFYSLQNQGDVLVLNDYQKIIDGIDLQKYVRVIRELKIAGKLEAVNVLARLLGNAAEERKKANELIQVIDHVISLFIEVDDKPCLEKLFQAINENKKLIKVLSNVQSEQYIALCQIAYYGNNQVSGL